VDWTSFRLEAQGSREEGTVKYAGDAGEGRWVVFPSSGSASGSAEEEWSVKWKDGELLFSLSLSRFLRLSVF